MINQFVVDLRPWWLRSRDEIGDTVVLVLKQALDMEALLACRLLAVNPSSDGVWPGEIQLPTPSRPAPEQKHTAVVYDSDEVTVEHVMTRDTRIDGVNWRLTFKISGQAIMTRRQRTRIGKALAQFARCRRLYLGELDLTANVTYLQISLPARVGVIAEPE